MMAVIQFIADYHLAFAILLGGIIAALLLDAYVRERKVSERDGQLDYPASRELPGS